MESNGKLSIYRAVRTIKRRDKSLYNALRSIYEDSIFVGEISQQWPDLPLLANIRCGLWYSPNFHSTCYFKSTDGHTNNWSFNISRLNRHVALLAGEKGGCIIVDSTRRGKRFPNSFSKTIPIWTCILNRAIFNHKRKVLDSEGILSWEFCARCHEELLLQRVVAPQVNQFFQVAQKCQSMIAETGTDGVSQQDLQTNSNMVLTTGRQLSKRFGVTITK